MFRFARMLFQNTVEESLPGWGLRGKGGPPSFAIPNSLSTNCLFGARCNHWNCEKRHPPEWPKSGKCAYGLSCNYQQCLFNHPSGWDPTNSRLVRCEHYEDCVRPNCCYVHSMDWDPFFSKRVRLCKVHFKIRDWRALQPTHDKHRRCYEDDPCDVSSRRASSLCIPARLKCRNSLWCRDEFCPNEHPKVWSPEDLYPEGKKPSCYRGQGCRCWKTHKDPPTMVGV